MKKNTMLLLSMIISIFYAGCSGGNNGSSVPNENIKLGKFSISKISPNSKTMKTVTNIDGGNVYASEIQYFLLNNIGNASINNIKIAILQPTANAPLTLDDDSINGPFFEVDNNGEITGFNTINFSANSLYMVEPNTIEALQPNSQNNFTQLLSITIQHGTSSNIGMIGNLPVQSAGIHNSYIAVYGFSGDSWITMVVKLSVLVKLADFELFFTLNGDSTNTVYPLSTMIDYQVIKDFLTANLTSWDGRGFYGSSGSNMINPQLNITNCLSLRFTNTGNVALNILYLETNENPIDRAEIFSRGQIVAAGESIDFPFDGTEGIVNLNICTNNTIYNYTKWEYTNFSSDSDVVKLWWP